MLTVVDEPDPSYYPLKLEKHLGHPQRIEQGVINLLNFSDCRDTMENV
jgi:hypothetical protein